MKILLVTESYWPNADGGALFERRLAHGLAAGGHKLSIWAPGVSAWRRYPQDDGQTVIYREKSVVFWANPKYRVSYWPFLFGPRLIWRLRPNVIHIHNTGWMGLTALLWAKIYRIPVVATNHFMPENALLNLRGVKWLYKPLEKLIWAFLVWFHNRCNFVTSPTPTAVDLLLKHGLKAQVQAITNGIDTNVFKSGLNTTAVIDKYKLPKTTPILLYLGRVDGEKRLDITIKALPVILAKTPVHLVIAGFGVAMEQMKALARQLKVESSITFTGFIDESDKPLLYNAASAFVISSPAELQSIVTLEAMSSGLPILSVDVAALKELCHDGQNGYLFGENNYQELAEKTVKLLTDKALIKQFSAGSQQIINQHHSTQITFTEYENVYKKVLN